MSTLTQALTIAEMQARDLLRRRAVMTLFVLLPAAFYYSVPGDEPYALVAGAMGVSWAVAAAGQFGVLGWRRADPRLALAGARPRAALLGRLLVLQVLGFALVALFAPQIATRSAVLITDRPVLLLALALMAVVSVPLGLAIGSLVPRELEGTLVLIGVVGVGMSVPPDSGLATALPLFGPLHALQVASGDPDAALVTAVVHAAVTSALLLAAAHLLWRRRTRLVR